MPKKRKKQAKNRQWVGIVVFVLLLIGAGVMIYAVVQELNKSSGTVQSERESDDINYEEPSDGEVAAGEEIKKEHQTEAENEGDTSVSNGSVFIVDAGQYGNEVEVRARVDGVVEDGGTCTYAFAGVGASFKKTQVATVNAKSTSCGSLVVAVSEFSAAGSWKVVVSYSGATQASAKLEIVK